MSHNNVNGKANGDLISRRALQFTFEAECIGDCMCCRYNNYQEEGSRLVSGCALIDGAPAVDAVPVVRSRWKMGVIISGYQGIGKSTLAKGGSGYIDLESGNFFVDGAREYDWFKAYSQIAVHLAEQGYRVFVSSHRLMREYLAEINTSVQMYACFPSHALEKPWIAKLKRRYEQSELNKDLRAWKNAECHYSESIKELHESQYIPIIIHSMDYSLSSLLDRCINCGVGDEGDCRLCVSEECTN